MSVVQKLYPEVNKVYLINQYTLFHILAGTGSIQVDFRNYSDWENKAIYLEKGQYIKFLSTDFVVRKIEFPDKAAFDDLNTRVLFKHLISLGYINLDECSECQRFLGNTVFSENIRSLIDVSSEQWFLQNPFQASRDEYQLIFEVKDVIDREFHNRLSGSELVELINSSGFQAQALVKNKVGLTVRKLQGRKILVESQKELAFTDKNIQEIAFGLGYEDPAYFHRVFKSSTGQSPGEFRKNFDFNNRDFFIEELLNLLEAHHAEHRNLQFYADQMNLAVGSLSNKVRRKMNASLGQLIRLEMIKSAKKMLKAGESVKAASLALGFEEPNHFSAFFKHHTGKSPANFN